MKLLKLQISKIILINEGRICVKLENIKLNIYQILIASFINVNNHFVPELLFKYDIKKSMDNDFNYLKRTNYKIFKKERISLNGNELGIIYDLKNINSNYQSNNIFIKQNIQSDFKIENVNITSVNDLISKNKNQSRIEELNKINANGDNFEVSSKNEQNKKNIVDRTKNILERKELNQLNAISKKEEKIMGNNNIEINIYNDSINDSNNSDVKLRARPQSNNNRKVFVEHRIALDEYKNYFISFLIRLYQFEKKMLIKINQ